MVGSSYLKNLSVRDGDLIQVWRLFLHFLGLSKIVVQLDSSIMVSADILEIYRNRREKKKVGLPAFCKIHGYCSWQAILK